MQAKKSKKKADAEEEEEGEAAAAAAAEEEEASGETSRIVAGSNVVTTRIVAPSEGRPSGSKKKAGKSTAAGGLEAMVDTSLTETELQREQRISDEFQPGNAWEWSAGEMRAA